MEEELERLMEEKDEEVHELLVRKKEVSAHQINHGVNHDFNSLLSVY